MRESKHWLPLKQIDEDTDQDPERHVTFDHLQGFIYAFGDPRQVFKLLLAWLHFLGVDIYHENQYELGLLGKWSHCVNSTILSYIFFQLRCVFNAV